jgi:hypothetical protein
MKSIRARLVALAFVGRAGVVAALSMLIGPVR